MHPIVMSVKGVDADTMTRWADELCLLSGYNVLERLEPSSKEESFGQVGVSRLILLALQGKCAIDQLKVVIERLVVSGWRSCGGSRKVGSSQG